MLLIKLFRTIAMSTRQSAAILEKLLDTSFSSYEFLGGLEAKLKSRALPDTDQHFPAF